MTLCGRKTQVYLDDFQNQHECVLDKHTGPVHLCECGHSWGEVKTTEDEINNHGLSLHFVLSEKQIIDMYLTVDNNDRLVDKFIRQHEAAGLTEAEDAQRAIALAHESSRRILDQITNQYPMIAARAAQVRQHMKRLGIIE